MTQTVAGVLDLYNMAACLSGYNTLVYWFRLQNYQANDQHGIGEDHSTCTASLKAPAVLISASTA